MRTLKLIGTINTNHHTWRYFSLGNRKILKADDYRGYYLGSGSYVSKKIERAINELTERNSD